VIYEALGHCFDKLKNYAQARFHYRKASHLSPEDSHLHYKIACTYMNEGQWESAIKNLDNAMRIHRTKPDYYFALAQCYMQIDKIKDAIIYFSNFIKARPRNIKGWRELIKCLYNSGFYEEALQQVNNALKNTTNKPLLIFYKSALLFSVGKSKEGLSLLETAAEKYPALLKHLIELEPSLLQHPQVTAIVAKYKTSRGSR
jgi:tetratricopeptide (TPR) repeat protein